jgi:hypothetical protein
MASSVRILDPRHGRMFWILHFYPMSGAPGAIRPVLALRDQSLQPKQAGMPEKVGANLALFEVG